MYDSFAWGGGGGGWQGETTGRPPKHKNVLKDLQQKAGGVSVVKL